MSNTPNFDAALDKIFADLKPHTRVCSETGESFDITERDIAMCRLLRVPPPTLAPWAMWRRQRSFVAGYELFRREGADGKELITYFDPESPATILPREEWLADAFDATAFATAASAEKSFFEQWTAFSRAMPRPHAWQWGVNENCDWSTYPAGSKNCYGCFSGGYDQRDNVYVDASVRCSYSAGAFYCTDCSYCYDIVDCVQCSRCSFCYVCEGSMDLAFCFASKNCSDCFGCTNLRNKKFCFLNEQLTEEEYRKRVAAIDLTDAHVALEWRKKIGDVWSRTFRRASMVARSEEATGDIINDSRRVAGVYIEKGEDVLHGAGIVGGKDLYDFSWGTANQQCFNTTETDECSMTHMSIQCLQCISVEYSELMTSCENCFGCIGLKHKKFCIFNKQYTEEEYWPMVDAIKTAMLARGEYGQFFPYAASLFAYGTSHSGVFFPLEEKAARNLGARWFTPPPAGGESLPIESLPYRLAETTDEILKQRFRCPVTGRSFAIVAPELRMHRDMKVALPRVHPIVERVRRTQEALPPILRDHKCDSCGKDIVTRLPSWLKAPIVCQSCYEAIVIGEKAAPVTAVPPLIARGG